VEVNLITQTVSWQCATGQCNVCVVT